jgi:hypothetical protein
MSSHKKNKLLHLKRRRQQRWMDRPWEPQSPQDPVIVYDPPGTEKMSEVLLDFVDPFQDLAETDDAYRKLLTVGMAAWNAALLSSAEREKMIQELGETLPPELRPDFRELLEPLIQRKLDCFAGNRRVIVDYQLTMAPEGERLLVLSTLPGDQSGEEYGQE